MSGPFAARLCLECDGCRSVTERLHCSVPRGYIAMYSIPTTTCFDLRINQCRLRQTPVGDWQSVQDIPRGWQITVVTQFTFPCIFEHANNEELICGPLRRNQASSDSDAIHVRRDRICELRVERRDGANMLAGAAGGGASARFLLLGARGPSAYILGLGGASMGAPVAAATCTFWMER